MPQAVESYLRSLRVPEAVKADAWDAIYTAKDDADAEARLRRLPVPNEVRADLWDLRAEAITPARETPPPAAATRGMLPQSTAAGDLGASPVPTMAARVGAGAMNVAPAIGESVGGMVGGMRGGRIGAVVGGAAGLGYGELIAHATEIPGAVVDVARNVVREPAATLRGAVEGIAEGARNIGVSGARQGALQIGGEAVSAGARATGRYFMNRATTRVSARLARDFPELSDTLIDNAITVSKGGEGKARSLLHAAKAKANIALTTAEQAGARIPVQLTPELAESFKTALLQQAMKTGGAKPAAGTPLTIATERLNPQTRAMLKSIDDTLTNGTPFDLTPTQADLLKIQLQKESRNLYAALRGPNGTPAIGEAAALKADFATELNTAIDAVAQGYKAANAVAQPLIGAVRGVQQARRPSGNLMQAMVRPGVGMAIGGGYGYEQGGSSGAVAGGIAGAALASPAGMSREAIILGHPTMQKLLRQMPRATAAAVMSFLATEAPRLQTASGDQAR